MISVVLPIYNVENYIEKCLASLLRQDYKDYELILVNDGSKDKSISLAKEFLKGKDVSWCVVDKENGGLASARNAGLRQADGDYVVFIDTDDVVSEDFLSTLLKEMQEGVDFSFCAFQFVKKQEVVADENDKKIVFDKKGLLDAFLKRTISFVVPSMLFRRDFLLENDLFFEEDIRFSEDQPFIWKVILHSEKTVYLYKKMYGYYVRETSIMNSSSKDKVIDSHREFVSVIEKYFSKYPEYEDIKEKLIPRWELGALYTAARILNYENYREVYDALGGKSILQRMKGIGEIKAYLLGTVCSLSPRLLYKFCQRLNLNG